MPNQWRITKDIINEPLGNYSFPTEIGTTSSRFDYAKDSAKGMPVRFKIYDDDDNLYFEGRMEEENFHPLDDFGMPSYGCTYLKYSRSGEKFKHL